MSSQPQLCVRLSLPALVSALVLGWPDVSLAQEEDREPPEWAGPSGMAEQPADAAAEAAHSHWQNTTGEEPEVLRPLDRNPAAGVTFQRIVEAPEQEPQNWLTYYGGYEGTRFSQLDQIDAQNVGKLEVAWRARFPVKEHGFEATPIVVDGVMYVTTGGNTRLYALDATTGEKLWHFAPDMPANLPICCDWVNRGAAIGYGNVYFNSIDGKLWALDAQDGTVQWSVQHAEPREGESATVAPLLLKDMVVTGVSGGEYGIRGYVAAFDAQTGEERWRFYTTQPGTWGGDAWITGGAPTWNTGTYDPERDTLFWSTGNASPDFNGLVRPGDNRWAAAVVALDPEDGTLKWGFQYTPHDVYDFDAIGQNILVDEMIDGKEVNLAVHADKNAFFWGIDRGNGQFVYAEQFARQTWAKEIDPRTGRPVVDPKALPTPEMKPICPSTTGATEWNPSSYSPQTHFVYIPVIEQCGTYRLSQAFFQRSLPFWGGYQVYTAFGPGEAHGYFMARDARTGEEVCKVKTTWPVAAATLPTAGGLVFWAEPNGVFNASDAGNCNVLWSDKTDLGVRGSAITYSVDGTQYVALPTGWGGDIISLLNAPRGHELVVWALP